MAAPGTVPTTTTKTATRMGSILCVIRTLSASWSTSRSLGRHEVTNPGATRRTLLKVNLPPKARSIGQKCRSGGGETGHGAGELTGGRGRTGEAATAAAAAL